MSTAAALAADFPALQREGLVYLDSSSSAQKPREVIEAMSEMLAHHYANIHRGVYPLAVEATDRFEGARAKVASLLGSTDAETIFTKNVTEAINLLAYSWGRRNVGEGDAIVLTRAEHHSNIVPWQLLCEQVGAELRYLDVDDEGEISLAQLDEHLSDGRVKLVTVFHVSNVLGTINPVAEICARAREAGAVSLLDGAQAVPQLPVRIGETGADFYAWTGHKLYGPTGIGVLHGRRELLEEMPPFLGGGDMIRRVGDRSSTFADLPWKFEAGTSPIVEAVGLGAAVDFVSRIGLEAIRAHELDLTAYAMHRLGELPGVAIHGPRDPEARGAVISFEVEGVHPHDVAEILSREGVCVRASHHCAQPLMRHLGVPASVRASFAVHNSRSDVDRLIDALGSVREIFGS